MRTAQYIDTLGCSAGVPPSVASLLRRTGPTGVFGDEDSAATGRLRCARVGFQGTLARPSQRPDRFLRSDARFSTSGLSAAATLASANPLGPRFSITPQLARMDLQQNPLLAPLSGCPWAGWPHVTRTGFRQPPPRFRPARVLRPRLYSCVNQEGIVELGDVPCLPTEDWLQPGAERLVPLEGQCGHITNDPFELLL